MNLDAIIEQATTIAISGHISPDGDCMGSCLGMYHYIKTYYPNKEVQVILEPYPEKFGLLPGTKNIKHQISNEKVYDLYFSMDSGSKDRLGFALEGYEKAKVQCCIDHHISNKSTCENKYIVPSASATCELVYELTCHREITKDMAQCLYLGIAHDTGVFQYSNTSKRTMEIAGALLGTGIQGSHIIENTYYEKTFVQIKLLGLALDKAQLLEDGTCIWSYITLEDMAKHQGIKSDVEGVVSQLRNTKGVEVAIFLYELEPGTFKVSLRSTDIVDSSVIAMHFQGGGHKKAAGFTVSGSPTEVLGLVLTQIRNELW